MQGHRDLKQSTFQKRQMNRTLENGSINESKGLEKKIQQSRSSGKLNISNLGLTCLPDAIWSSVNQQTKLDVRFDRGISTNESAAWWEVVDLTCFFAANNEIQELDGRLSEFEALIMLDFHHNCIQTLEKVDFTSLKNLTSLNFSYNQLTSLPDTLFDLPLVELNLKNNQLNSLSSSVGRLKSLKSLSLSNNKISILPKELNQLSLLSSLNLSNNKISDLSALFSVGHQLNLLKDLDVSQNCVERLTNKNEGDVEEEIRFSSLTRLDLKLNRLRHIPRGIRWPNLKDLCLAGNKIEHVNSLPIGLEMLDVKDNQLTIVPENVWEITSLKRLDLSNNNIKFLEPKLGLLSNLQILLFSGNPMKGILHGPTSKILKTLRDRIPVETPDKIQSVSKSMETLDIKKHTDLSPFQITVGSLDLSNKQLHQKNVDVRVKVDFHPSSLNLDKNEFTETPVQWIHVNFSNLTSLSICQNGLTQFPALRLPCLRTLYLSGNKISSFPRSISASQFPKLLELDLSMNALSELEFDGEFPFPVLQTFFLSNNQIGNISNCLPLLYRGARNLQTLDLSNNDILVIPPELGKLSWIKTLILDGNPFKIPRRAILQKGTEAVLSYLRDRIPPNSS